MNYIELKIDGQLYCGDRPMETAPLNYLGYEVRLALQCTLRSLFQCLERYPGLQDLNPFIGSFVAHYHKCPQQGCSCPGIDYLALWRTVEIIGHPAPARTQISVSLRGYQGTKPDDIQLYWLESLLDMPLRLGRLDHVVFGDRLNAMQFDTVFNLFELIDGICWQLSFHNLPVECRLTLPGGGPNES